jgi:hypothetical protein
MSKAKLYYVDTSASGLARRYSILPKSRHPGPTDFIWLPVSQIEGTTKYPPKGDEWPVHIVTIPDWLARKHNI